MHVRSFYDYLLFLSQMTNHCKIIITISVCLNFYYTEDFLVNFIFHKFFCESLSTDVFAEHISLPKMSSNFQLLAANLWTSKNKILIIDY